MRPTEREVAIRRAASAAAYGEPHDALEPAFPSPAEVCYLQAREHFLAGRQCAGWDAIESGDRHSGYPYA